MKLALLSSLLLTSASAFAPVTHNRHATTRYMAEAEAAVEAAAPAAEADAPAADADAAPAEEAEPAEIIPEGPQKVPCFGATPFYTKEPVFFGENYWDKITMEWGTADTGKYIRAAELKHGRAAMLGTVGFAFHKLGFTFNNISPHEYLSVTQGIKFADLQAMTPMEAVLKVPAEGFTQVFGIIAVIELYELTHMNGKFKGEQTVAPGLQPGGLTGDLGWNPLQVAVTDDRRLAELQNARLAMVCIMAWLAHDAIPGSVPIPFPW